MRKYEIKKRARKGAVFLRPCGLLRFSRKGAAGQSCTLMLTGRFFSIYVGEFDGVMFVYPYIVGCIYLIYSEFWK